MCVCVCVCVCVCFVICVYVYAFECNSYVCVLCVCTFYSVLTTLLCTSHMHTYSFFPDKNVPNYGYSDGVMKCLNSVFVSKVGRSDGLYGTR